MRLPVVLGALLVSALCCLAGTVEDYASTISPLIDPAKLATLGNRGANQRVRKYVYWLGMARIDKLDPRKVAVEAVRVAGYKGEGAAMTDHRHDAQSRYCDAVGLL